MGKNKAKQRGKKEASPTKLERGPYKKPGNNISKKRHSQAVKAHRMPAHTHVHMCPCTCAHTHTQCICCFCSITKPRLTVHNPMDCSPPGSSVHGILQTKILKWVTISFSRGSSQPRDRTWVSWTAGRFLTIWATKEAKMVTEIDN